MWHRLIHRVQLFEQANYSDFMRRRLQSQPMLPHHEMGSLKQQR